MRTIGSVFGMSYGFETVHWLLVDAWTGAVYFDDHYVDSGLQLQFDMGEGRS